MSPAIAGNARHGRGSRKYNFGLLTGDFARLENKGSSSVTMPARSRGGGRPKGVPNKLSQNLKNLIQDEMVRSDNGPDFVAKAVRDWHSRLDVPGSPWENGYIESFNGKLRDELLNREIFTTLEEAKVLTEGWRREYNQVRPHSALGYKPPAPEAVSGP